MAQPGPELLDHKGFTFLDDRGDAYWVGMRDGNAWLARRMPDWNWMLLREVTQGDVFQYSEQAKRKPGPALPFS